MSIKKNYLSVLLMFLLFFVIISVNVKANALDYQHIKIASGTTEQGAVISEYSMEEDTYLDIYNISLETAIDNSCSGVDSSDSNYQATGSITQVVEENSINEDNSTIYYVGETTDELVIDDNNMIMASETDASNDYYVENWQELEGDLSIKVNKQASCVTVYKGETPIRAMICSAGETTPEGTFYMESQWDWLILIKGQYGRYCSQISGDYLFHSVPYNSMNIYDLDTEMYNQLGTLCSHGCIRLTVEDAKWIYDNCYSGVEITIYNDENPGPMGKPGFNKIPDTQTYDPTDIDVQ